MYTKTDIKNEIEKIVDPSVNKTLKETGGIKHIGIDEQENIVNLVIATNDLDQPNQTAIKRELARIIKLDLGFKGIKIDFELLKISGSILEREVKYIGVASGKGGVGKSTVTANLAYALKRIGKKVAIIDADVYGSSIPNILNMELTPPRGTKDEKIIPFEVDGIELISTEFFLSDDKPLMWRGPMLQKMIKHFFYDTKWHQDIEYVLIDLPPGTGDVTMDIQSIVPQSKMLIVTTPHKSASHIAVKAGYAAETLSHEILGVVENMSYYLIDGVEHSIFGKGGGKEVADKLKTTLLQQIPIAQPEDHSSIYSMNEEAGLAYIGLAKKIINKF